MFSLSPNLQKVYAIWRFAKNSLGCLLWVRYFQTTLHVFLLLVDSYPETYIGISPFVLQEVSWDGEWYGTGLSGAARSHLRWGQEWAETRAKCEVVSRDASAHCAESSAEEMTFKVVSSWGKTPGLYTPGTITGYGISWEGNVILHHVTVFSCDSLWSGNQLKPASWNNKYLFLKGDLGSVSQLLSQPTLYSAQIHFYLCFWERLLQDASWPILLGDA